MNKIIILVFCAVTLFLLINKQSHVPASPYSWHEDSPGQWSALRPEGNMLYAISEASKAPLYQIETKCPPSETGETVEIVQWRAGDRMGELITCSNKVHEIEIPSSLLEEMDPLPPSAQALFKKNWEQPSSSPDGEMLYAQGIPRRP